jgi:hypothetical protein
MNTAYFQSTITELNKAATYINKYTAYVNKQITSIESQPLPNGTLAIPGVLSPCGQLALLAVQVTEKFAKISSKTTQNTNKATADIAKMQSNILTEMQILESLMIVPTDLPSVLTWIQKVINAYAGPYAAYTGQQLQIAEQEALLVAAVTRLTTAIANATLTLTEAVANAQSKLGCVI